MNRRPLSSQAPVRKADGSAIAGGSPPVQIARKWSWHYRELTRLMDRLITECQDRKAQDSHPIEHHHFNLADSATDEADHDLRRADSSHTQETLSEVDAALKRIVAGRYGICEATGVPIDPARLRAIPWTRFSKDAEQQLEEKGLLKKPHLGALGSVRPGQTLGVGSIDPEEQETTEAADETLREIPSKRLEGTRHARKSQTRETAEQRSKSE